MTTPSSCGRIRLPAVSDDAFSLRAAFSRIPQSVAAVCALNASSRPAGLVVSTLTAASLSPPLVLICVKTGSRTWRELREAPHLGVSVFAETQGETSRLLACGGERRFETLEHQVTAGGAVLVSGAVMWMECAYVSECQAGDHQVIVLRIETLSRSADREPLVFHLSRYRRLRAG